MSDAVRSHGRTRVLFVTWDGPEYHYLESLFLPIFARLGEHGFDFDVLQFTWGDPARRLETFAAAKRLGVGYGAVDVIRRPIAAGSLLTALLGGAKVRAAVKARQSDIVLARSTLPALSTSLAIKTLPRTRFVLDLDGLATDERVDFGGLSPTSLVARLLWRIEAEATVLADAVTSRSDFASRMVAERAGVSPGKFFRVPNSRDENLFTPASPDQRRAARAELGLGPEAPVIGYVGSSLAGKYRGDCLLSFYQKVRTALPEARLLILVSDPATAERMVAEQAPDLADGVAIRRAPSSQVPFLLGAADLGTAFIEPSPSMKAAAAVKLGEYLLCGIPAVATAGIGDVHERIEEPAVLFLKDNGSAEIERAAQWFCGWWGSDNRAQRLAARASGVAEFALEEGAERLARALRFALGERSGLSRRGFPR